MCQGAIDHPWAEFQAGLRWKRGRAATFQGDPWVLPIQVRCWRAFRHQVHLFGGRSNEVVRTIRGGYFYSQGPVSADRVSAETGRTPKIMSSLMRKFQMIKRDPAFQLPSWSTSVTLPSTAGVLHVSSGLTARWLRQFPRVHPHLLFCLPSLRLILPLANFFQCSMTSDWNRTAPILILMLTNISMHYFSTYYEYLALFIDIFGALNYGSSFP